MKTSKKHLVGFAVILAAIIFAFIGCSVSGDKGLTEHEIAAANFKDEHSEALELNTEDVSTVHEAIVKAALDAHDALHQSVKDLLTEEKAKLDKLKARIDELKAAATPEQLAETFTTHHEDALELDIESVTIYDETKVNAALDAYELLDEEVKELLEDEKTLLDELKAKIGELKATLTPEQLAEAFTTYYEDALALDVGTVSIEHEAIVNAALNAYELLGENAKELLTDEKALLDSLKTKIEQLKLETAVNTFKSDYSVILDKDTDSVTLEDESSVNTALAAYNALLENAKALLTEEKALLDNLKTKIDTLKQEAAADSFKSIHSAALALDVDTAAAEDEIIVFAALNAYELLGDEVKALLTEEKALLDSLKEKIDGLVIRTAEAWRAAISIINNGGNGTSTSQKYYTLTIGGDFELAGSTSNTFSPSYITVILNGRGTISLSSNDNLIRIVSNQTLVIDSENLTLKGRSDNNNSVLYVNTGSQLELRNGTISDNTSSYYGGGVYVNSGTFTMDGGSISDNTSSYYGGGVYVTGSGTFTMNGGSISSNNSSSGGGVYVSSGTFTMSDGSISNNIANSNGGGVFVYGSSTFTMSDGNISSNNAYNSGGGVYVSSYGTFTVDGGSISDNTSSYGSGVYVTGSGTFTMNGGSISDNIATSHGGGVYVNSGTFTMDGGSISSNNAFYGGGVSVIGGTFTMDGGSISSNNASYGGGGVYVISSGTFTMSGGNISDNNASSVFGNGGGVYVDSYGTFTKASGDTPSNSGVISGNTATTANGQQVRWDSTPARYVNDPLGETDELSTEDTENGWLSQ